MGNVTVREVNAIFFLNFIFETIVVLLLCPCNIALISEHKYTSTYSTV